MTKWNLNLKEQAGSYKSWLAQGKRWEVFMAEDKNHVIVDNKDIKNMI